MLKNKSKFKDKYDSEETLNRTSLVKQIVGILTSRIYRGVYKPNSKIPSGEKLALEFKVSRATMRTAIALLANNGLVIRMNGVGVFTTPRIPVQNSLNVATDFYHLIEQNGLKPDVKNIKVSLEKVNTDLEKSLMMQENDLAVVTWKIFTANKKPVIYCKNTLASSLLGKELTKKLIKNPKLNNSLFDMLESECGLVTSHTVTNLKVALSKDCNFPKFQQDPSSPVLILEEIGYSQFEKPIWHSREIYPNNSISFNLVRRHNNDLLG